MHEKEHPSESVIIIESAPMHASSTQHKKMYFTHTQTLRRSYEEKSPDYIITFIMVAFTKKHSS